MREEDHCRWFLDPGPLAPWIDRFGAELAGRRYSRLTISGYTDAARHFAAWVNSTSTPIQIACSPGWTRSEIMRRNSTEKADNRADLRAFLRIMVI
ncbi:MAG: hypothetical protein U1E61_04480 [Bradyrhizobium sp.]